MSKKVSPQNLVTNTEDEGEDSHSGAQPAGAEAVIDDADLDGLVLVPPPALARDAAKHNDGENLEENMIIKKH